MRLTTFHLQEMLGGLQALEATKLNITQFVISGHTISVQKVDSQRDGSIYYITGIETYDNTK